jgi:hypothetical protein
MIGDISYKYYKKKSDIHGTILYPAPMVAPVQKDILQDLINETEINTIFDPFHGSGTALYESLEISNKLQLFGCDINPLANLITQVKLQGVSPNINNDIRDLKLYLKGEFDENYIFPNIDKWFRKDIANELRKIRSAIIKIEDKQNRLFFWYMMCDITRKYSNTRSSTYKLHIKNIDVINRMENLVLRDYIYSVNQNVDKFHNNTSAFKLWKCDALTKIQQFENEVFDISITSPPYGENATTVPYGQFSILSLNWIDKSDLELEGWELDNYSTIDSHSMGGNKKVVIMDDFEKSLIEPYLNRISINKKQKVIRFFNDYFKFMRELCRVTKVYIVMTLGNRTVDGVNINLTEITNIFLEKRNFRNQQLIEREIPNKRTPKKTSSVNNKPVSSMNYEYVIINKKIS